MARIVIIGAGVTGLVAALLLDGDGHDVTVLERDPEPPPAPGDAWRDWNRRGVNQFRQPHLFMPRFRAVMEAELPAVAAALDAAGALRYNLLRLAPPEVAGAARPGDERFEALTGRRPFAEAAIAGAAADLDVRRGVIVAGLVVRQQGSAPPHVTGVRTAGGEEIRADVVVDAMGRRSALPAWLEAAGARRPAELVDDLGFVYHCRTFRSPDGTAPEASGPLLQPYGSISALTVPCDHGTWGLALVTSSADTALRGLRDEDRWLAVARALPSAGRLVDGEPLEDRVAVLAGLPDRLRRYVVGGRPVATGVLAVGDSWACTNPSAGRGTSLAAMHAVALRDLMREGIEDPVALATEWAAVTDEALLPYFEDTLRFDRFRLAAVQAIVHGTEPPEGPEWELGQAFQDAAWQDPDCLRASLGVVSVLSTGAGALGDPGVMDKVIKLGASWRDRPPAGPDRAGLVALAGG